MDNPESVVLGPIVTEIASPIVRSIVGDIGPTGDALLKEDGGYLLTEAEGSLLLE